MAYKGFSKNYQIGQEILDFSKGKLGDIGGALLSEFGPVGYVGGESLGAAFDYGAQAIFDKITGTSRYVRGNWYKWDNDLGRYVYITEEENNKPQKIPKGAKFVQDPRWVIKNEEMDILPFKKINVTEPFVPLKPPNSQGFDINNFDPRLPVVKIYDDGINHNIQPHPSSKRISNAAMPYNSQGFTSKRQR